MDVVICEEIYLLLAYPKNEQDNLTEEQKKILRLTVKILKEGKG